MAKSKERRTPPPTMESIVHKAKAKKGEAEYKRSTDPDELKKKTTQKRPPKVLVYGPKKWGQNLAQLWASSWAYVGPSWHQLGPWWPQLGVKFWTQKMGPEFGPPIK